MHTVEPIIARTRTVHRPVGPVAYDCVKVIFVRDGSAFLFSEFGERPVRPGDVILLGANVLCGSDPERHITVTTIYANTDYVLDQVFWQHIGVLQHRLDARDFAAMVYTEPAQVLRLGEDRAGMLMPWLDELVALSLEGRAVANFFRMQALWFSIAHVIAPFIKTSHVRISSSQRATGWPASPCARRFVPLRAEARAAASRLREDPARGWTLGELAEAVHLSPSQLGRVFVDAYGQSPMTFLAGLRAERLARLLRESDLPIEVAMAEVGWHSRGHAARQFRQAVGLTPQRYRQRSRGSAA